MILDLSNFIRRAIIRITKQSVRVLPRNFLPVLACDLLGCDKACVQMAGDNIINFRGDKLNYRWKYSMSNSQLKRVLNSK